MNKQIAIIEFGGYSKIHCPIAKLSALMGVLEHCQVVSEQSLVDEYTGEITSDGEPIQNSIDVYTESRDPITMKIVNEIKVISIAEYDQRRKDASVTEKRLREEAVSSHPFRFAAGDGNTMRHGRYRTLSECREAAEGDYYVKQAKGRYTIFEGDEEVEKQVADVA